MNLKEHKLVCHFLNESQTFVNFRRRGSSLSLTLKMGAWWSDTSCPHTFLSKKSQSKTQNTLLLTTTFLLLPYWDYTHLVNFQLNQGNESNKRKQITHEMALHAAKRFGETKLKGFFCHFCLTHQFIPCIIKVQITQESSVLLVNDWKISCLEIQFRQTLYVGQIQCGKEVSLGSSFHMISSFRFL